MEYLKDFIYFGLKQAYACLFGGLLLFFILASKYLWQEDFFLARYDFLFIIALLIQIFLIFFKFETIDEVKVIFVFHIVGTIMEIFKTSVGSWVYPEHNFIRLAGVPLFSGFMYSAVGSYMARALRIFDIKFKNYPSQIYVIFLSVLIYVNFFTHHYIYDFRIILFTIFIFIFFRTTIFYRPRNKFYSMPVVLSTTLVSFFIWLAENVGTFGKIWSYPSQINQWHYVSFSKMGSWFLLIIISFSIVSLIHKPKIITQNP